MVKRTFVIIFGVSGGSLLIVSSLSTFVQCCGGSSSVIYADAVITVEMHCTMILHDAFFWTITSNSIRLQLWNCKLFAASRSCIKGFHLLHVQYIPQFCWCRSTIWTWLLWNYPVWRTRNVRHIHTHHNVHTMFINKTISQIQWCNIQSQMRGCV